MEISKAEFRSKCYAILDQVDKARTEFIITKQGRPIAKLTRYEEELQSQPFPGDPLLGALAGLGRTIGDVTSSVAETKDWEMD
jgi:antitoxin (DNA-binding transcriptional repressor) of toxin-antitoxin stability system